MIKPTILNEYYLSPNDIRAIAETTLALYVSNMMRKRNMLSEGEHNQILDECAHRIAPAFSLLEGNTYESRKRIYSLDQLTEEFTQHFDRMLNEGLGDWVSGAWNGIKNGVKSAGKWIGDKAEKFGLYKRGDTFGRNFARAFGFEPDEGLSFGNLLNGAITIGSLVAAPFTGGGSVAGGMAARAGLGTAARALGSTLLKGGAKSMISNGAKNLASRAARNLATSAGRNAVLRTGMKNLGKNLALMHGINIGMKTIFPNLRNPSGGTEQLQYADGYGNPYGSIYGGDYGNNYGGGYGSNYGSMNMTNDPAYMQYLLSQQGGGYSGGYVGGYANNYGGGYNGGSYDGRTGGMNYASPEFMQYLLSQQNNPYGYYRLA